MTTHTPMAPAQIAPLPVPPTLDDPVEFDQRGDTFVSALPGFQQQANALAEIVAHNAVMAHAAAQTAGVHADAARGSAGAAAAFATAAATASNVKGAWASLTGPLSPPATAYHAERYWTLLHPIPDVAASEPGASADWALVSSVTDEILATMQAVALAM